MTKDEAMKLALEWMEAIVNSNWRNWGEIASPEEFERWVKIRANHSAVVLRQALEQPDAIEAAVLTEREACAKASEFQIERWSDDRARYAAGECAAAIRQRMK